VSTSKTSEISVSVCAYEPDDPVTGFSARARDRDMRRERARLPLKSGLLKRGFSEFRESQERL
jgi:hypothetical protein